MLKQIALVLSILMLGPGVFGDTDTLQSGKFFERKPAEVEYINRAQLNTLVEADIDIGSFDRKVLKVWVTEEEYRWIEESGYSIRWVPDQAKLYFDELMKQTEKTQNLLGAYHTYDELTSTLQAFAENYPAICRLSSIGQSVQGRELWALKITDHPDLEENEPEFKYISTMHGNEALGTEIMIYLIELLLEEYGSNDRISDLVNETEIWIIPLMNPDGRESVSRYNANGIDLNRNFPDRVSSPHNTPDGRQPETQAVMAFSGQHRFILGANFHTGALVVNYPYDSTFFPNQDQHPDWFTPDNDVFVSLSILYASQNPPMYASSVFDNGITNGISWYWMYGGMQDWNYVWMGCQEVTIELSNTFMPPENQLLQYWENNRESLLSYMEQVHTGIRGRITDARTGEPLDGVITVAGRDYQVYSDPDVGDYYRILRPGTYTLTFQAEGYRPKKISGVEVISGSATTLNVTLNPLSDSIWIAY